LGIQIAIRISIVTFMQTMLGYLASIRLMVARRGTTLIRNIIMEVNTSLCRAANVSFELE